MSELTPIVRAAILSDDIRTEINGKHMIIGTYGPDIGVSAFPHQLKFRLTIVLDLLGGTQFKLKLRFVGPTGDEAAAFESDLEVERPGANVPVPAMGFIMKFESAGSFRLEQYEGDDWKFIASWNVSEAEPMDLREDATLARG